MASIASPYKALQLPLGALFALSEVLSGSALNTTALMVLLCLHMRRLRNRLHSRIGGNACSEEVRADGGPSSAQDGLVEPAPPQSSNGIWGELEELNKGRVEDYTVKEQSLLVIPSSNIHACHLARSHGLSTVSVWHAWHWHLTCAFYYSCAWS